MPHLSFTLWFLYPKIMSEEYIYAPPHCTPFSHHTYFLPHRSEYVHPALYSSTITVGSPQNIPFTAKYFTASWTHVLTLVIGEKAL
jgi:hypothetical protein